MIYNHMYTNRRRLTLGGSPVANCSFAKHVFIYIHVYTYTRMNICMIVCIYLYVGWLLEHALPQTAPTPPTAALLQLMWVCVCERIRDSPSSRKILNVRNCCRAISSTRVFSISLSGLCLSVCLCWPIFIWLFFQKSFCVYFLTWV